VVDGDGGWIYEGLLENSLLVMSDGSYDPLLVDDVCSCAAIIECQRTGKRASVIHGWRKATDILLTTIGLKYWVVLRCSLLFVLRVKANILVPR
jgi:hypothetical protein